MKSSVENINYYKAQIEQGDLQAGYHALMNFIKELRNSLKSENPTHQFLGDFHYGMMDFTFFAFTTALLKNDRLKVVVIFNHQDFKFEICLVGQNKQIQKKYWNLFQGSDWDKYQLPTNIKDTYSIVEYVLEERPDFSHTEHLMNSINSNVTQFVKDIEDIFV